MEIRLLEMEVLEPRGDGHLIRITGDGQTARLFFSPVSKHLEFLSQGVLPEFLRGHVGQLRRLLHNKKPETFYPGFRLPFSLVVGKDVAAFNNRDNLVVVDGRTGRTLVKPKSQGRTLPVVYTDGSYDERRQKGGFAVLVRYPDGTETTSARVTRSRSSSLIELEAVIHALECVSGDLRVVTDSQYVRKGITEWIIHWRHNGWLTANGKRARNISKWQRLDRLCQGRYIELEWVKSHSNHLENDYCDAASRRIIEESTKENES